MSLMDFMLSGHQSSTLHGTIGAHPLITVTLRQPAGFFDQWSRCPSVRQFVIKRKVHDVQCKALRVGAL
jgi:hypothetical protein